MHCSVPGKFCVSTCPVDVMMFVCSKQSATFAETVPLEKNWTVRSTQNTSMPPKRTMAQSVLSPAHRTWQHHSGDSDGQKQTVGAISYSDQKVH
eukprot:m.1043750 g.1043750  ORF g.1043750 m.1043750 type:complete len:94 (+) comp24168_c0_seq24:4604-4885(+)